MAQYAPGINKSAYRHIRVSAVEPIAEDIGSQLPWIGESRKQVKRIQGKRKRNEGYLVSI